MPPLCRRSAATLPKGLAVVLAHCLLLHPLSLSSPTLLCLQAVQCFRFWWNTVAGRAIQAVCARRAGEGASRGGC